MIAVRTILSVAFSAVMASQCVAQTLPIVNPGFESISRPLIQGEITNGAGGVGVEVGTRFGFADPPQFEDPVVVPGWRTFLPPKGNPFTILTGVLNPPLVDGGQPFLEGYSGVNVASARNVWMQQTLPVLVEPDTHYQLDFLCGIGLNEPGDGVFAALVASPDLETLAFVGVPGVTTLVFSHFSVPFESAGQMLPWTVDYVSPETLPGEIDGKFIAVAFVGSDGVPIMNFDDFHLVATRMGDVNKDGSVDLLDVAPFVDLVTDGEYLVVADINRDGAVNLLDINPFVQLLTGG